MNDKQGQNAFLNILSFQKNLSVWVLLGQLFEMQNLVTFS
jgi:hypothetical protein